MTAVRKFYPGDLADALQGGNLALAKAYLAAGEADPNDANAHGCTALMWAIKLNSLEMVDLLLDAGADVNKTTEDGSTALMWAAARGNADIVRRLIREKADVNAKNTKNETAVTWALEWIIRYGRSHAALNILVSAGAHTSDEVKRFETVRSRSVDERSAAWQREDDLREKEEAQAALRLLKQARQEVLRKNAPRIKLKKPGEP